MTNSNPTQTEAAARRWRERLKIVSDRRVRSPKEQADAAASFLRDHRNCARAFEYVRGLLRSPDITMAFDPDSKKQRQLLSALEDFMRKALPNPTDAMVDLDSVLVSLEESDA